MDLNVEKLKNHKFNTCLTNTPKRTRNIRRTFSSLLTESRSKYQNPIHVNEYDFKYFRSLTF